METLNMDWIDEMISEDDDELDWYEDLAYEYDAEAVEQAQHRAQHEQHRAEPYVGGAAVL